MPFTPFHMGPGLAVKAVSGRRFSLMVFGFCQVAIDIEPLVRMLRGDIVIHGFTQTYLGATLVAFVGAYSHVFLDSLMHSDMQPYAPVSQANGLLHLVSVDALHVVCVLSGGLGAVVIFSLFLLRRGARVDGRA